MRLFTAIVAFLTSVSAAVAAPSIDADLKAALASAPLTPQAAVITYQSRPGALELQRLATAGIDGGVVMNNLPMVLTAIDRSQLLALQAQPGILSVYGNHVYQPYTNASRTFIGQTALQRDAEVIYANGGVPVSGKGVGVAVIDTGVDGTHNDLKLGNNLVQNVYFPLADAVAPLGQAGVDIQPGFLPPVSVEDFAMTDIEGGHGTFVAGAIGATGAQSGGFYGGVAPGADLIGLVAGNDTGLQSFAILHAYDWILSNQNRYNIRVANNSFGAPIGSAENYDPFDPINVGSRAMHDRYIAVVFAAGNEGDVPGAINALAVAPWVISVAAGEKEGFGSPASFSSRGIDNGSGVNSAPHPADPNQAPNLRPDIIGPGANIKSTRSKGLGVTNLAGTALGQDLDIAPAFLPFYTTSQGTSFSAPHVAGVVALMIEANPMITPQQIMEILRATAMPMPYEERVVGAGYVDAHNAVRAALNMTRVAPPADLIPGPGAPEIIDIRGDQLGTAAHDILTVDFAYDPAMNQVVYTMQVAGLDEPAPNTRWTMQSQFGDTAVFVSASVNELGAEEYEYGRITTLETGTQNQETIGVADEGSIDAATGIVRMALGADLISAAVGSNVVGATSTSVQARTQLLIGTSFTGGLLLAADSGTGRDFTLGGGDGGSNSGGDGGNGGDAPATVCGDGDEDEEKLRFAGAILAGEMHEPVAFINQCDSIEAKLTYHPGDGDLALVLEDADGAEIARASHGDGRRLKSLPLAKGDYRIRIDGAATESVDYVIEVKEKD
jgi:subtilisin family serine protease